MPYEIRRFYRDREDPYDVVATYETLEEAQEHCENPETSNVEEGWFDGWTEVDSRTEILDELTDLSHDYEGGYQ